MSSLRNRLMLSYAVLAAFSILVVSFSANLFMEARFRVYVQDRIASEKQQILKNLDDAWTASQTWNGDELSMIGMNALERGFIIRLADAGGTVLWDARTHNNGMCEQILANLARTMDSHYRGWNGGYQEETFSLQSAGVAIATVWIGYYGPYWFNDSELYFLSSLNQIVALSALAALVLAAAFGWFMARGLARPIQQVTATAHQLRQGELKARSQLQSSVREIADLALSINSLGQSLADQEALRRRLTTDISHELRTPLSTLRAQLEAMIDGIWSADTSRLESCREEVLRLTRLVVQVEGLALAEAPDASLALADLERTVFLERLCLLQASDFQQRGITFVQETENCRFRADPDKLSQILVNLLSNAAKFSPRGSTVCLRSGLIRRENRDWLQISVQDQGPGIPPVDRPHIFERFYRVDASRSTAGGGAGIGLTIALSLARLHGGTIELDCQEVSGSIFRLLLPFTPFTAV